MRIAGALAAMLLLTGCGDAGEDERVTTVDLPGRPGDPQPAPPPMLGPTEQDLAKLDDPDCRSVAEAYANAVYRKSFAFAAMFWTEDAATSASLEERYAGYAAPQFQISRAMEEGGPGPRLCTVTGALGDPTMPDIPLRQGTIELQQGDDAGSRWQITGITLEEAGSRAGEGAPA